MKHSCEPFTSFEIAVFFFLREMVSISRSYSNLPCSATRRAAQLGISRPTFIKARKRLIERGLIAPANPDGPNPLNRISFVVS